MNLLLYNVYIVNHWKSITEKLLHNVPHEELCVHISVDWHHYWKVPFIKKWFQKKYRPVAVFVSTNSKYPEVKAFTKLKSCINLQKHGILTYLHGKGVTKPGNENIKDWVELMRYFIMDRFEETKAAFKKGFKLYGINVHITPENDFSGPYKFSGFHFSGNFVSVNLQLVGEKLLATPLDEDYFGLEAFWGKLCDLPEVYSPFHSHVNHYLTPFPESRYKS